MNIRGGNEWIQKAMERLSSNGFKIAKDVSYGGQTFGVVAHRSRFELSKFGNSETFFVFAGFDTLSRETMQHFSGMAFRYAQASKKSWLPCGLFESVYCFSVAVVDALDGTVAESVRNEPPSKHVAAAEIPVVYECDQGRLSYFEKTPVWGAAYYAGFRKQIREFLVG